MMRNIVGYFSILLICGIFTNAYASLTPDLEKMLERAGTRDFIPVNIVLKEQVNSRKLLEEVKTLSKNERRKYVINKLKKFSERTQAELLSYLRNVETLGKVKNIRSLWIANLISCEATKDVIRKLAMNPEVKSIDWDEKRNMLLDVIKPSNFALPDKTIGNTPPGIEETVWNLYTINAPSVWELGYTGNGVIVGILDTGVNYNHSDLNDHVWENLDEIPNNGIDDDNNGYVDDYYGYNFAYDTSDPMDDHGHGTHCAGTIAGDGTAGIQTGVAPDAAIMSLKVLDSWGSGLESDVWEAIQYAVANGADVMSFSIGWMHAWNPDRTTWRQVLDDALAAGVISAVAAGNERDSGDPAPDNVRTPGDVPPPWINPDQPTPWGEVSDVVTVGATDINDVIAYFSSFGPVSWGNVSPFFDWDYPPGLYDPDVTAPGVNITSLDYADPNGYEYGWSGTSMATPHVAGLMALLLQSDPELTPYKIDSIIELTAVDLGSSGKDNDYGAGRIDAFAAVMAILPIRIIHTPLPDYEDPQPYYPVVAQITSQEAPLNLNALFVYYRVGNGDFISLNMLPTGNPDEYEADIPYQYPPATVSYYIYAEDTIGNNTTSPPNAPQNTYNFYIGPIVTLLYEDVESGQGEWTHQANTPNYGDQWHISTQRYHSLSHSWKCGDVGSGNYADSLDAVLVTPPISLPDYGPKKLIFWHWMFAETSSYYIGSAYDGGIVEINDGSGWQQIFPEGGYPFIQRGGSGSPLPAGTPIFSGQIPWSQVTFDLSNYSGVVQIRFRFASDRAVNYEGWYIDDIELTGPPVTPIFTRGDANTDGNVDVTDAVYILIHLFPTPMFLCERAADVNLDSILSITDVTYLLDNLFPLPSLPPPDSCGQSVLDILPCDTFPPCGWATAIEKRPSLQVKVGLEFGEIEREKGYSHIPIYVNTDGEIAAFQFKLSYDGKSQLWVENSGCVTENYDYFNSFVGENKIMVASVVSLTPSTQRKAVKYMESGKYKVAEIKIKGNEVPNFTPEEVIFSDIYGYRIVSKKTPGVKEKGKNLPRSFSLSQNLPNPFRHETEIRYTLPKEVKVKLVIYNVTGQKVRTLVSGKENAGYKSVRWDGRDDKGRRVSPGVYFYRLEAGDYESIRKLILIK